MNGKVRILVVVLAAALVSVCWAGLDKAKLGENMAEAGKYDYGQSREVLTDVEAMIQASYEDEEDLAAIEVELIDLLNSDVSFAAKQWACEKLSVIGTDASVSVLADMVVEAQYSDIARYALERIPGNEADEALRASLDKTSEKVQVGIINTIGMRGDAEAVEQLAKLLGGDDKQVAAASAAALGRIGNAEAAKALAKATEKSKGILRGEVLDAYLKCAEAAVVRGERDAARGMYKAVYEGDNLVAVRAAGLRGWILTAKEPAEVIGKVLEGNDQAMQAAAIGLLGQVKGDEVVKVTMEKMDGLSALGKVQLISAWGDMGAKQTKEKVLAAVESEDEAVRVAALAALKYVGDASVVDELAAKAASGRGAEQEAAKESLYQLTGEGVDEKILAIIPAADTAVKVELIRSIEQRRMAEAKSELFAIASGPDARAAVEALKVLAVVGTSEDVGGIVDMLVMAEDSRVAAEAQRALSAVARSSGADVAPILEALEDSSDVLVKSSLMMSLGKIGDAKGLGVLREALDSSDEEIRKAAIKALSEWPGAEPADDLLKVAKSGESEVERVLALRGYVSLIGRGSDRSAEETVEMYAEAMELAPNAREKRNVLSGLGEMKSVEALEMAACYLDDDQLKREAAAAVVRIAGATRDSEPTRTNAVLQKVIDTADSESLRDHAKNLMK